MLNATINLHLSKFQCHVAINIKENIYVDNILSGATQKLRYWNTIPRQGQLWDKLDLIYDRGQRLQLMTNY